MIVKFRKEPIQRQRWGDKQCLPHTNWGDIFFDLFYVAAAYNLAYIIKTDPNPLGLLYFLGCFGPVISVWLRKLYYDSVFQLPDDIFHAGLEIIQLTFLSGAILHIRPVTYMSNDSYPTMFFFCLSCWLCMVYTLLSYLEIRFWGVVGESSAKYSAMTSILIDLPTFLLVSIATIYSGYQYLNHDVNDNYSSNETSFQHIPIILMLSSWIVQQIVMYPMRIWRGKGKDFKKYHVPVNVEFIIHRQGEFTMLMLGESVLSLLTTDGISSESSLFYITFYVGVLSVTLLQYLYFKCQPHDANNHAMRRSRPGASWFLIFIQIYSAALVIVGVSFKMLLTEYKYDKYSDSEAADKEYESSSSNYGRFLAGSDDEASMSDEERRRRIATFFCVGLGISFLTLDCMSVAHAGIKAIHDRFYNEKVAFARAVVLSLYISRFLITAFIFTAFLHTTEPDLIALYGFISIILQVFLRLVGFVFFHPPEESSHGHKHSSNDEKLKKVEEMHLSTRTQSTKLANPHYGEHNLYEESLHDQMQSSNDEVKEVEVMKWPNRTQSTKLANPHYGEHNLYEEYLHDQMQSSNDEKLKKVEEMHLSTRTQPKLVNPHYGEHNLYEEYLHDQMQSSNDEVMKWPNRTQPKSIHLHNGDLYEEYLHDQTTQSSNDEEKNTEAMHLPNRTQPKLFDLHNGDHYEDSLHHEKQSSNDKGKEVEVMQRPKHRTQSKLVNLHSGDLYDEYSDDHHVVLKEQHIDDHHHLN